MPMLHDLATLPAGMRLTGQGFAVGTALACRTGLQRYLSTELGLDGPQREIVLLRPRETVMARPSMATLAHKPVVSDHPPGGSVDATSFRKHAVGWVGDDVAVEGEHLRIPLCIADAETVRAIVGGKRQISCGYNATIDWSRPGKTATGEAYDGVVTAITYDHVAIVQHGRAGSARLGDAHPNTGVQVMSNVIRIGDAELEVDPRVAAELGRLRAEAAIRDARAALPDSVRIIADARDALLRQEARNNDPATPQGAYRARLRNAHRNPPSCGNG